MGVQCFSRLCSLIGCEDPYFNVKEKLHQIALKYLEKTHSRDLTFLIKLALAGNSLDPCVIGYNLRELESFVDVDEKALSKLVDILLSPDIKRIAFLLDNNGEAVLDSLLIRELSSKGKDVKVYVKGSPFETDVTVGDVSRFGLNELFEGAEILDTGGAYPAFLSTNVRAKLGEVDLILAKGLANYESFIDSPVNVPTALLLKVKCPVLANKLSKPQGSYVIVLENFS